MKFFTFSIKNKIILLTLLSLLGSNLFLASLLLIKIQQSAVDSQPILTNSILNEFLNAATVENLTFISLLFISFCSVLTYFFIRKFTQPLEELVFASNQLGYDVSSINFPTDSDDELAALAASLESMNKTIIKQNESLKNSELRNRSIMDNMSDGLITISTDGIIHTFNNSAEKLFGYTAEEIQGKSMTLLMPDHYQIKFNQFLNTYLTKPLPVEHNQLEMTGIRKDGSQFEMEISITEMILQNRKGSDKRFFIGLCRNIEERKKNEMQLRMAEKIAVMAKDEAERANLAKSQFLSRMSHEFRTPLNAVMGFSQLALYDAQSDFDKSAMQSIYNAGEHLLAMVDNVLDIACMETGEIDITLEIMEIIAILKEVYQQTIKLAAKHKIEILLSIKESQPAIFIKADKDRLKQILLILITNAIKFNRPSGTVILSIRESSHHQVGISVKDHGMGIAKENLDLIFKPFERLDAYNQGIDGLGIGLAIAKQLTEAMGGTIGVESTENVGSLFYIFFPIYQPENDSILLLDS